MFPDLRLRRLSFEYPGSAGAGPRHVSMVNEAEEDVFLEFSCFFYDPADVDSLISGSSAVSKTSLSIWKFSVHVLLKSGLENFELACAMSAIIQQFEHSLALTFFVIGMKTDPFQSCVATAEFSKFTGTLNVALSQHFI